MLDYARKGIGALPGANSSYLPMIWLQDARALFVALTEQVLPIWVRLFGVFGMGMFNFKVVK